MFPLNPLVSTVLRTRGTSKTRAALASATLLLMIAWRSKLATPKSICGWRSISVTTQLSGVSNPFSLRFARAFSFVMISPCKWRRQAPSFNHTHGLRPQEGQQIGVDLVFEGRAHAVG